MTPHRLLDRLMPRPAGRRRIHRPRFRRLRLEGLEDRTLLASFTVTSANGGTGPGTLYDAIAQADADTDKNDLIDTIDFAIPGTGPYTISLQEPLPVITRSVNIDGTSQPGSAYGKPQIVIDGTSAGDCNGLDFVVGNNLVEGLVIDNFKSTSGNGYGIVLDGSSNTSGGGSYITGNFIGVDASGTKKEGNTAGILLYDSSNNTIGGVNLVDNDSATLIGGNLISGNAQSGIFIENALSTDNVIFGNFIGTDVTGLVGLGNGFDGIFMGCSPANVIPNFPSDNQVTSFDPIGKDYEPDDRNVIGGNGHNGVYILGGTGNEVQGAYIGIGSDGLTPVPNGEDGVRIEDGSSNTVGGIVSGSGNVISANKHNGVEIVADETSEQGVDVPVEDQFAQHNLVEQNLIGTNSAGTPSNVNGALGNGQDGVALTENNPAGLVSGNVIGGIDGSNGILDGKDEAGNLISGNLANGVYLLGMAVVNNSVEGNYIGTNLTGTAPIPNAVAGVYLDDIPSESAGPSGNSIGGTSAGAGNLISGNGQQAVAGGTAGHGDGIVLLNGSNGNSVLANMIGTDDSGELALGNAGNGIEINSSAANTIGGNVSSMGNVISRNSGDGVLITGLSATNNQLQFNVIGVGADFTTPLPNTMGVVISTGASGTQIGGTEMDGGQVVSLGNVIACNAGDGINIASNGNQVIGNDIGADPLLTAGLGNQGNGVTLSNASNNTIGGTTAAAANYIVSNAFDGVDILSAPPGDTATATGNVVEGNYIGIGRDPNVPLPNDLDGVDIANAAGNSIGVNVAGGGNVISFNDQDGVRIEGGLATGNVVANDKIGTTPDGNSPAGNGLASNGAATLDDRIASGVAIVDDAASNTIGVPGALGGNVISGNVASGVVLSAAGGQNVLMDDVIGINALGSAALLGVSPQGVGVLIDNTPAAVVGAATFAQGGNVISGNTNSGTFVDGALSVGTQIEGNYIGTDITASSPLGNGVDGLVFSSNSPFGASLDPHTEKKA